MIDFHKPYDPTEFENFLRDFLPEDFVVQNKELVKGGFWKCVKEWRIIGYSKSLNTHILELAHESDYDPRVTLTKESFRIISEIPTSKALVIFKNSENKRYRFSLITIDLDINDETNKIERSYSNAKRYSFLLGEWEPVLTVKQQLEKRISDFKDLQSRFDVEVVRKPFFDDYFDLFVRLYIGISKDSHFCDILSNSGVDRVKFAKNLLGKIIFVYFIQKKGWLGVEKNKEWWVGDRKFLRTLWERFSRGENFVRPSTEYFYNDYLEHLFYNGFNKDRRDDDDYEPNMRFRIPYLNGGLFKEDYEGWENFTAKISNDIFSSKDEKKPGILDVFDTYNFTVDEDDPYDAEIAIDPEMLGKIFEKMISISKENIDDIVSIYQEKGKARIGKELNKKFGAFYTPRDIVHYMCQESLVQYLIQSTKIEEDRIRDLVKRKELSNDWASIDAYINLPIDQRVIIDWYISEIDDKLQKIKILDPAVGSGAFPMGLLHEISWVRWYFRHHGFINDQKDLYNIKKETIQESIYWVDIEPGAIDIARLRFWLSLIVDEEKPEPLPNFEFKFVCANTLIPLSGEESQLDIFGQNDEANLDTLKKYKREYYKASGKKEKEELKNKIRKYAEIGQITLGRDPSKRALQIHEFWVHFDNPNHSHSFFDPSLMLGEWRKFDIVIGNPPYVSIWSKKWPTLDKEAEILESLYSTYEYKTNLFALFIEKSISLLRNDWIFSFILPRVLLDNHFLKKSRGFILKTTVLLLILEFKYRIFDWAETWWNIILSSRKNWNTKNNFFKWKIINSPEDFFKIKYSDFNQGDYIKTENNNFVIFDASYGPLIEKIKNHTSLLWEICYINNGVNTGNVANILLSRTNEGFKYRKILEWKDINKFSVAWNNLWINYDSSLKLSISLNELATKQTKVDFALRKEEIFLRPKIIIRQTADKIIAAYDQNWFITRHSTHLIAPMPETVDIKYLLAILNSKLLTWFYRKIVPETWKAFAEVKIINLEKLPIKISTNQQPIIEATNRIIESKNNNPNINTLDLENEINRLVYEIYWITSDEIKTIEESLEK
ncbi:MAG: hypothetical protein ACD_71C00215G0008 [uncultured bacterium (gcode 4)]|uniref:site-specific DNA-methyltransferase (adenine-specific) n=1 Tax=uncultured bacterium (gcode 4) TaxID=1234023 RepID=K1Z4N6_9BACT|nr:MAG: hypothetical protein ACD_71C00215G0008 [uncultured bacterium (gcode 4)]